MNLQLLIIGLFTFGCIFFTFVGVVGLIRLPDVYSRAHAVSKADTLGAGCALLAAAIAFGWGSAMVKSLLLLVIIFITNPTAIHALVRSAYQSNVPVWTRSGGTPSNES